MYIENHTTKHVIEELIQDKQKNVEMQMLTGIVQRRVPKYEKIKNRNEFLSQKSNGGRYNISNINQQLTIYQ